jgi:hypothetical protein
LHTLEFLPAKAEEFAQVFDCLLVQEVLAITLGCSTVATGDVPVIG